MKTLLPTLLFLCSFSFSHAQSTWYPEGPDAPNASFTYLNGVFEMSLFNSGGNNMNEGYLETAADMDTAFANRLLAFQGYMIYQVLNDTIAPNDLHDLAFARLVAQSDIQDGIVDLIITDYDTVSTVCTLRQAVAGDNIGIEHVYHFDTDAFGPNPFVPGETYCYVAIAYAENMDRLHPICGSQNQFVGSKKGSGGPVLIHCVTADNSLATNDANEAPFAVSMYPNPATDFVQINLEGAGSAQLACFDLLGNLVYNQQISASANIPLSNFSKGVYLVRITADGQHPITQKLVVR